MMIGITKANRNHNMFGFKNCISANVMNADQQAHGIILEKTQKESFNLKVATELLGFLSFKP